MELDIIEFKCTIEKLVFSKENFKIYGVTVDTKKYPSIVLNQYGNCSIIGDLHVLTIGNEYIVSATPKKSKYGMSYEVKNIKMDKPITKDDTVKFLSEILTNRQCNILLSVYPNIIELIEKNRTHEIDFSLLKGIKQASFRKIEKKIKENLVYADLVAELQGQIEFNIIKKMFDKYTSKESVLHKLKTNGYRCLMDLPRIGFKRADSIMINIYNFCKQEEQAGKIPVIIFDYNLLESSQRCEAAVRHILEENENSQGNTRTIISSVENDIKKIVPECNQHFFDVLLNVDMFYSDKDFIALRKTYNTEQFITNKLLEAFRYENVWDCQCEEFKKVEGFDLSDEQFNILPTICQNSVVLLVGNAGSGKSSSAQAVINMAKAYKKSFKLMSPTAKAAKVLKEYTHEDASTIHRALGMAILEESLNTAEILDYDLIVVDEASMIDIRLAKALISCIDFSRTKLLFIGDDSQLPSVGAGNLLFDLINSKVLPIVKLTKVFRNSGGILKTSMHIRFMEKYLEDNGMIQYIGDDNGYCFIPTAQEMCVDQVINGYQTLLTNGYNPEDIMVLSAYKKGDYGTNKLNNLLQPLANPSYKQKRSIVYYDTTFYEGDIVMQITNNYNAVKYVDKSFIEDLEYDEDIPIYSDLDTSDNVFIANGESGTIKEIKTNLKGETQIIIDFDGVVVEYGYDDLSMITLGYAITIHKSQGSSCKIAILLTPQAHAYFLNSNLLYVGETRAKEKVFHIGSPLTINKAVKKKADFNRNTFLKEMLINTYNMIEEQI